MSAEPRNGVPPPGQITADHEGITAWLGIALAYPCHLREHRPDLWDADVNGWLHGNDLASYPPDDRSLRGAPEGVRYEQ